MALATPALGEGRELAATLVNALAHHGLAADPRLAARHIQAIIAGEQVKANDEGVIWLQQQIARINAELDS
jgi:hypothetical protein